LRADDLRADDFRAAEARFGALFFIPDERFVPDLRADEARFGALLRALLFRELPAREEDLRAGAFRPPERPPVFLPPLEPPRDDFLAAAMLRAPI
jgi:hypothetical protein